MASNPPAGTNHNEVLHPHAQVRTPFAAYQMYYELYQGERSDPWAGNYASVMTAVDAILHQLGLQDVSINQYPSHFYVNLPENVN